MKVLLHICCAPCTLYPLDALRREGAAVTGFFYNPNIHPSEEYGRRLEALRDYARAADLDLRVRDEYGLVPFLREVVFHEADRCRRCYSLRLAEAAREAAALGADAFTTTLLYSVYQDHETVRRIGEEQGRRAGVAWLYRDFRAGWKEGVRRSRELGLYRQKYCGCIYSEMERTGRPEAVPGRAAAPRRSRGRTA